MSDKNYNNNTMGDAAPYSSSYSSFCGRMDELLRLVTDTSGGRKQRKHLRNGGDKGGGDEIEQAVTGILSEMGVAVGIRVECSEKEKKEKKEKKNIMSYVKEKKEKEEETIVVEDNDDYDCEEDGMGEENEHGFINKKEALSGSNGCKEKNDDDGDDEKPKKYEGEKKVDGSVAGIIRTHITTNTIEKMKGENKDSNEMNFIINDSTKRIKTTSPALNIDDVPLGLEGQRMMVTFGDGHNPVPAAVSAALEGTRSCIQRAIRECRCLKRKERLEFQRARKFATYHRSRVADVQADLAEAVEGKVCGGVDAVSMFKAAVGEIGPSRDDDVVGDGDVDDDNGNASGVIAGHCGPGFDSGQINSLFPEEMGAYDRWKKAS